MKRLFFMLIVLFIFYLGIQFIFYWLSNGQEINYRIKDGNNNFDVVDNHKSTHEGTASYYVSFYPTDSKGKTISKYLINFRISDHFIPNLNKKSTGYYRKLAQNNSRTEGKQRWKLEALIVNDRTFDSYDDALDYLDTTFSKLGHR